MPRTFLRNSTVSLPSSTRVGVCPFAVACLLLSALLCIATGASRVEGAWPEGWTSGVGGAYGTPIELTEARTGDGVVPDPLGPAALAMIAEIIEVPVETLGWTGGRRINELERHDFLPIYAGKVSMTSPLRVIVSRQGMLVAILGEPEQIFPSPTAELEPLWFQEESEFERCVALLLSERQQILRHRDGWYPLRDTLFPAIEFTLTGDDPHDEERLIVTLGGEVILRESVICHLDGECEFHGKSPANWSPNWPGTPIFSQPLPNLDVIVDGIGTVTTDSDGLVSVDLAGTPRTISGTLSGPYVSVLDARGPEIQLSGTITPNVPFSLTVNDVPVEDDTAEVSAFVHANRTHDWFKAMPISPPFTDMDVPLQVRVSRPSFGFCNAAFNPNVPELYFLPEAIASCPNSAFSTIVVHEYAHAAAFQIFGSNTPGDLHEGLADCAAILYSGDREIGRGFFGTGNQLRDAEPNLVFPISGSAHTIGLLYAGSIWDLRTLLVSDLGKVAGSTLVSELWFESLFFLPAALNSELVTVTLLADDDDGNLANGTPNETRIREAFAIHGLRTETVALEPIASLSDFPSQTDVTFSWSPGPGAAYTELRVERNGVEVASLAGTDTTWTDVTIPPGEYVYIFRAFNGAIEAPPTPFFLHQRKFRRGDVNGNGSFNIGDVVVILDHLFISANSVAQCPDLADINDNGIVNIADVVALLQYLFAGANQPPSPFIFSDVDPTPDTLPCAGEL